MKKKKKDNKLKTFLSKLKDSKVAKFFNDPRPLIIVLMVICVLLIVAFANYKSKYKVYSGYYESDTISIRAVHVYTHPKLNIFFSSGASYLGEKKQVYQYKIGYYYKSGDTYYSLKETWEDSATSPVDLADIISKVSYFNYTEFTSKSSNIFTPRALDNLDDIHFMVYASTTESTDDKYDIAIDCKIDFTKF